MIHHPSHRFVNTVWQCIPPTPSSLVSPCHQQYATSLPITASSLISSLLRDNSFVISSLQRPISSCQHKSSMFNCKIVYGKYVWRNINFLLRSFKRKSVKQLWHGWNVFFILRLNNKSEINSIINFSLPLNN